MTYLTAGFRISTATQRKLNRETLPSASRMNLHPLLESDTERLSVSHQPCIPILPICQRKPITPEDKLGIGEEPHDSHGD